VSDETVQHKKRRATARAERGAHRAERNGHPRAHERGTNNGAHAEARADADKPRAARKAAARATPAATNGSAQPPVRTPVPQQPASVRAPAPAAELIDVEQAPTRELKRRTLPADATGDGAVMITGIVGRMGLLLARKLHRGGRVIGVDRRKFDGMPEDIVHHQIDLRRSKMRDIFRAGEIKAVVHLGVMHNLRESDKTHHEWNVVGFQKLLEYLSQYRVPKLVVLSSATLYGPSPSNPQFLTEEAPLLGAQEFSRIRDLVEVDMLAQSFFWKHPEVETVILRPCHILGRVRNAPSNYCRMERPLSVLGFDPMLQVIHERDVVDAIALALEPGTRGIFNLRGPGEMPLSRMFRLLGKRPIAVPGPMIKGLAGSMWSSRVAGFPMPEIDHLRYVCMVDDRRAREELGFAPKYDMEQTLRAVLAER
jgi:UDP-glucose 4-epimerase